MSGQSVKKDIPDKRDRERKVREGKGIFPRESSRGKINSHFCEEPMSLHLRRGSTKKTGMGVDTIIRETI